MANVLFKRVEDSSLLDNYPIVDGNLWITGDGKTFIDYGNERIPVGGTPDVEMSDISTNAVQNNIIKQYVDDVGDRVSTFEYNLVTDGDAVKTGRQIDGKDEWVKRFSFTTTGNQDYTKPLGFTLSDVIVTEIKGTELSTANNWIDVSIGDFNNSTAQSQNIKLVNSNNTIFLTSNNNCKLTIVNVYFIYRN